MENLGKEKCFIITPIGDDTDPIRRHIEGIIDAAIIPAMGEKYEIVVAHKISEPGSITKQIISEIYNAKLVIANLTNRNPNVMYELALRHAIGKPSIMIAEKGTSLPADIITERTIFYQNDAKGVLELREALSHAEKAVSFESKCGPIVDVVGELSHDTVIIEAVEQTNANDTQPFEYILRKLDKLETMLTRSKSIDSPTAESCEPRILLMLRFSYQSCSEACDKEKLYLHMRRRFRYSNDVQLSKVRVDEPNQIIEVNCRLRTEHVPASLIEYLQKLISGLGFVGVEPNLN